LADYVRAPAIPFFLWLRAIAGNKLLELHRHHLGTGMRDAGREVSLYRGRLPETTSAALAAQLLGHLTRPSEAAVRAEIKVRLQEALNSMEALNREVLALRHFEQLTTSETAQVIFGAIAGAAMAGIVEMDLGVRIIRIVGKALRRRREDHSERQHTDRCPSADGKTSSRHRRKRSTTMDWVVEMNTQADGDPLWLHCERLSRC
jgi:hypothetical protein